MIGFGSKSGLSRSQQARRMTRVPCVLLLVAAWVAALFGFDPLFADDGLVTIHRVYIPFDQVADLGDRFPELRAMSREEFDELARRAQSASQAVLPQVELAKYQASLEDTQLNGTAEISIHGRQDARTLLRWPVSPWTISRVRWTSGEASLGYAGRNELGLVIPAEEFQTLTFVWSAPTRLTEAGRRVDIRVPSSLRGEMALDLPRGLTATSTSGLVSGPTDAPRPELQRWLIRWSPAESINLLLVKDGGSQPLAPLLVYERDMEADVSEEGTELLARFTVTAAHQPVRQIDFDCSPGLRVFGVSGARVHNWTERDGLVQLELAEPLVGTAQISLRVVAPGSEEGRWKLPRMEVHDGTWIGGNTRVHTTPGLNLYDVQAVAGRVVGVHDTENNRPELVIVQAAADPGLSAKVSMEQPQVFAKVHTSIALGERIDASAEIRWQIASGEVAVFRMRLPHGWRVQGVDGIPQGVFSRWSVDSADAQTQSLTLRLSRPQSDGASIVSRVHLSGPELNSESATSNLVVPRIRPCGVHVSEETLTVEASPLWSAELKETSQLTAIPRPSTVSVGTSGGPPGQTYRFDGPDASGKLDIRRQPAELTAGIDAAVEIDQELTRVKYTFDLESTSGQTEWLDLRFQPGANALTWDLPDGFHAERLSGDGAEHHAMEVWRVTLPRKPTRRFRLTAGWRAPSSASMKIPLPTVEHSALTAGRVSLVTPISVSIDPTTEGLIPISSPLDAEPEALHKVDQRRRAWRYGQGEPRLELRISRDSAKEPSASWIAHTHARTVLDSNGAAIHHIRYEVHSQPGSWLTLQFPSSTKLRKALSSGQPFPISSGEELLLPCPAIAGPWFVDIEYASSGSVLGRCGKVEVDLPWASMPSLRFSWELNSPGGYAPMRWSEALNAAPPRPAKSWIERLFGPLARDSQNEIFEFWKPDAWHAWWRNQTEPASDPLEKSLHVSLRDFQREVRPRDRTWAKWIVHVDQFTGRRLVIDRTAIEEAGIDFGSAVSALEDPAHDGLAGLGSTTLLSILRTRQGFLLTTPEQANALSNPSSGSELRRLLKQGGLPQAIDQTLMHGIDASGRFVLLSHWGRSTDLLAQGPKGTDIPDLSTSETWRFESDTAPQSITVWFVRIALVRQATAGVVGLAFLMFCLSKTGKSRLRSATCGFIGGVGIALAIIVPAPLSAPAAVLGWSQLALSLLSWRHRRGDRQGEMLSEVVEKFPSALVQAGAIGTVLLFLTVSPQPTPGALQEDAKSSSRNAFVFIPYDPDQPGKRHQAPRVLVPRSTYAQLQELARTKTEIVNQVLVRSCLYAGKIVDNRMDLTIDLEIESLASGEPARCSLPFTGVLIRSAQLDGQPTLLSPELEGLVLDVSGSGLHRLHIEGVLSLDFAANGGTIDLVVPPAPVTKLDWELPSDMRLELETPVTSLQRHTTLEMQRFTAELGASGRFVARFARGPSKPAVIRTDSASLLTWERDVPRLEVRILAHVESGNVTKLMLQPDTRLLLTRIKAPALAGYWLRPIGDASQLVLEFERPIEKQVSITLEFIVRESPDESMRIPEVRVLEAQARSRLIALRGDLKTTLKLSDPPDTKLATVEDFQTLWGEFLPASPATMIVRMGNDATPLQVTRTRDSRVAAVRAQGELRVSSVRVELLAHLSSDMAGEKTFRHELLLPPGWQLRNVRTSPGSDWRSLTAERILWYGTGSDESSPTIDLDGWLPIHSDAFELPAVRPAGDCEVTGSLSVWNSRDIKVSVLDVRGMRPAISQAEARTPESGLVLEGTYAIESADYSATISVERLSPRITASVASRVVLEEGGVGWTAVVDYQVTDGAMSHLELRVPTSINSPIQVESEGIRQRTVRQVESDQVWTIQLQEPRWNAYRLVLRAKLDESPNQRLVVPRVIPQDVAESRQYLLLVNAREQVPEFYGLDDQGSISVESFAKWFSEPVTGRAVGAFELHGPIGPIEFQQPASDVPTAGPTTILERHRCWLRSSGSVVTESLLLIRSRTSVEFPLALPHPASVLEMRVDGQPVPASTNADGQPRAYLEAGDRAHEVLLWWTWDLVLDQEMVGGHKIELTRLTNSTCPSIWTAHVPPQLQVSSSAPGFTCRSLAEAMLAQALAGELERMLPLPKSSESSDRGATLWDMERAFLAVANSARRALEIETEVGLVSRDLRADHDRAALQLARLVDQNRQLLERSGLTSLLARAETQVQHTVSPYGSLLLTSSEGASQSLTTVRSARAYEGPVPSGSTYYLVTDNQGVSLRCRQPIRTWTPASRYFVLGLCGVIGAVTCLFLTRGRVRRLALPIGLLLAGAFWCWKLQPEPVGPAFLCAGVIAAVVILGQTLRRPRPTAAAPAN